MKGAILIKFKDEESRPAAIIATLRETETFNKQSRETLTRSHMIFATKDYLDMRQPKPDILKSGDYSEAKLDRKNELEVEFVRPIHEGFQPSVKFSQDTYFTRLHHLSVKVLDLQQQTLIEQTKQVWLGQLTTLHHDIT